MLRCLNLVAAVLAMGQMAMAAAADRHVVVVTLDGFPAYYLNDPKVELPVIRGLRDSGASTEQGMIVSNPSVTWPNHTTLMTGVRPATHGVLYNGLPERHGVGQPATVTRDKTQQELVHVPMLFDILKQQGLTSAAIHWPCTTGSKSIDDHFPVAPKELERATPRLRAELRKAGLVEKYKDGGAVERDEVCVEAACLVLKERKPRLLALHLGELDATHHQNGPNTPQGREAANKLDGLIGRLLKGLDEAGIRDKTTVFVLADHGFIAVTKTINPNVALVKEGLIELKDGKIAKARAHVIPEGGIGMVYLTDPATREKDRATVRRLFEKTEGVAAVLDASDFPGLGLPTPDKHPGMADMIIAAKDGYGVGGSVTAKAVVVKQKKQNGKHGYLNTEPKMNALFVAAGAGIKSGSKLPSIENINIAPTVAHLLGVELDQADGRVLTKFLSDDAK